MTFFLPQNFYETEKTKVSFGMFIFFTLQSSLNILYLEV